MFQPTRPRAWMSVCAALLFVWCALPVSAQNEHPLRVQSELHHDVSPALRDLPKLTPRVDLLPQEAEPARPGRAAS